MTPQEKNKLKNDSMSIAICKRTMIDLTDWNNFLLTFNMRADSNKMCTFLSGIYICNGLTIKRAYDDYKINYELSVDMQKCPSKEKKMRFTKYLMNAGMLDQTVAEDLTDEVNDMGSAFNEDVSKVSEVEMDHEIRKLTNEIGR